MAHHRGNRLAQSVPWRSTPQGVIEIVGPQWHAFSGSQWQTEDADRWQSWLDDRHGANQYLKRWRDAHARGLAFMAPCRLILPSGCTMNVRSTGTPVIEKRVLKGFIGHGTVTVLDR